MLPVGFQVNTRCSTTNTRFSGGPNKPVIDYDALIKEYGKDYDRLCNERGFNYLERNGFGTDALRGYLDGKLGKPYRGNKENVNAFEYDNGYSISQSF